MRTLLIAAEYPWPVNSGSRLRLESTLRALGELGPVDLFSIVSDQREDFAPAPAGATRRTRRMAIDERPAPGGWARAAIRPYMPFEIPVHRARSVARSAAEFASGTYDLVWFFRVRAWVLAANPQMAPAVVDLDDLEDQKIMARLSAAESVPRGHGAVDTARRQLAGALWKADVRRWRRLHVRISQRSAATVVCSDLDAARVGLPKVHVVPNGYDPPRHPVGRIEVSSPPTIMFQGTLRYPPNADAARFLVDEVVPRLRELVPEVRLRLVGLAAPALTAAADPPRVEVTGQVPDITKELSRSDLVVVPLRFASGTRVKILEAFAHRIPVVATTIGAEGLDVMDMVHLLVADDAEEIARACALLLEDVGLRKRLVESAHELYCKRYRSSATGEQVAALASEVASR